MKIIIDELPKHHTECLFCIRDAGEREFHKCLFQLATNDFIDGLNLSTDSCYLTHNLECPFLKKIFDQKYNDIALINF